MENALGRREAIRYGLLWLVVAGCAQPAWPATAVADRPARLVHRCAAEVWPDSSAPLLTTDAVPAAAEARVSTGLGPENLWTTGSKTVLVVRVNFPDDPAEPGTGQAAEEMMAGVKEFYLANSYGRVLLESAMTPLLTLPRTVAEYANDPGRCYALRDDALVLARTAGFSPEDYDLDIVLNGRLFGNRANVKARGCWLQAPSTDAAVHELGHNFGLGHANLWIGRGDTMVGPGRMLPYGNMFDAMADVIPGGWAERHFNAAHKHLLGWLPEAHVLAVTNSGVYRLHPVDAPALDPGAAYALTVMKDPGRTYWIESRQESTASAWARQGVLLYFGPWDQSYGTSPLLDTTPNSNWADDSADAPLLLGRTFSDPAAGVHITPLSRSSTIPHWVDVQVVLGRFPENRPPTVTLEVGPGQTDPARLWVGQAWSTDPDGDPVVLSWDFGDGTFAALTNTVEKRWDAPGEYLVRCWGSDLKGGVTFAARIVRVGQPAAWRVSGRITCQGQPLAGARVSLTDSLVTYTDGNGFYTAVGLTHGYYQLHPGKGYFTFTPPSRFVVISNAHLLGQDFEAAWTDAPNNPPYVTTWNPGAESSYGMPAHVPLQAWAYDDGEVQLVEFTAGQGLAAWGLGNSYTEIWTNLWSNAPPGEHLIVARAMDELGAVGQAWPTRIRVVEDLPLILTVARRPGAGVALDISGTAGQALVVESSTNLVDWSALGTCTNLTGHVQWLDPEADRFQQRLYRARILGVSP